MIKREVKEGQTWFLNGVKSIVVTVERVDHERRVVFFRDEENKKYGGPLETFLAEYTLLLKTKKGTSQE